VKEWVGGGECASLLQAVANLIYLHAYIYFASSVSVQGNYSDALLVANAIDFQ